MVELSYNMPTIKPDLLPGTQKSDKILKAIRERFNYSYRQMSQNFPFWDLAEEHYRAFRSLDDDDRESYRKNQVTKIVVPIQFATIQTILTFLLEVFTAVKPVLKVRGSDPASKRPATVMEACLDYDYRGNKGYMMFYHWFLNALRYGWGIMENTWGKDVILKRKVGFGPSSIINIEGQDFQIPGAMSSKNSYFTTFEGNKWQVIDNRSWFPDPRVPLTRFQEGEFCGRRSFVHSNTLRKMEDEGFYFNTTKIDKSPVVGQASREFEGNIPPSSRDRVTPEQAFGMELADAKKSKMHIEETIVIELCPKDYGLSQEERPEQWMFVIIDGNTIVRAEPNPFYGFPFSIIEPYPDILASVSQGLMDLTEPLSAHLSFLFNSHMANVRKVINDTILVDPSKVNLNDLLDPAAGKVIRMLPAAFGQDPAMFIKQLQVMDVTQGHMADSNAIIKLWEQLIGVSSNMFGQVAPGRRTASELQGVMKSSGARMKMMADLFSSEGVAPLTQMMALSRQENMTEEQFVEIAGRTAEELGVPAEAVMEGFMKVGKNHLSGVFTYPAEEGVLPQDRAQAAQILMKVFETVAGAPFLAQVFDPVEIFRETIRQSGLHNIDDFLKRGVRAQVLVMPNEQVAVDLARGKIAPMEGRGVGRPDQGVRDGNEGLNLAGLLDGAGISQDGY